MQDAPWFVAPADQWRDGEIDLPPSESHHASAVLRIAPGEVIRVTDGNGRIAFCTVRSEDARLVAEIEDLEQRERPAPEIAVYVGAAKGKKVDEVVDRLGELGVGEVWVYESTRAVARWDDEKIARLERRWRDIAQAAAKQSRSPFVARVHGGLSWGDLIARTEREPHPVVLWEAASLPMRSALGPGPERMALVVGPEGGLSVQEAQALADAGARLVSLGPRILRAELAPVVATTIVLGHYGLIG